MTDNEIDNFDKTIDKSIKCTDSSIDVVFFGRPGSGKSTAVKTIGNGLVFSSGHLGINGLDKKTEMGIDYSEHQLDTGSKLRLYVTPGQKKYNDLHFKAVADADIYIILIDLTSAAPFAEFMHYKKIISVLGNEKALRITAFTHYDQREHDISQLSKEIRNKCYKEMLTVKVDVRSKDEMQFMLEKTINLILGKTPPQQYYAENNLFLKNIN